MFENSLILAYDSEIMFKTLNYLAIEPSLNTKFVHISRSTTWTIVAAGANCTTSHTELTCNTAKPSPRDEPIGNSVDVHRRQRGTSTPSHWPEG